MYCDKTRIYCHECNRSYLHSIYSNHLRSRGHIDNVMKKRCYSCNNHDLTCCTISLSLKLCDNTQIDFSNKQDRIRKQSIKYKDIDPDILLDVYRMHYSGCYNDTESIVEAKAFLSELHRIDAIYWREYIGFLSKNHD